MEEQLYYQCDALLDSVSHALQSASDPHFQVPVFSSEIDTATWKAVKDLAKPQALTASTILEQMSHSTLSRRLVITLYPGTEGYTLCIPGRGVETPRLPYDDTEILRALDAERLPTCLLDLLDSVAEDDPHLFWQGCLLAEIRDLRQSSNTAHTSPSRLVLLKPDTASILADAKRIARQIGADETEVESQLVLATQEPLCLDPSPLATLVSLRQQAQQHRFTTNSLTRHAKRLSVVARRRRSTNLAEGSDAARTFRLASFLTANAKRRQRVPCRLRETAPSSPVLAAPSSYDVHLYGRAVDKPPDVVDCVPRVIEEYILETERSPGWAHLTRLTLKQRMASEEVLGELYVERDHREGQQNSQGSSCKFTLPTRAQATRYVQQFNEIFTEEGRKPVKMTHKVPGHPPRVTYTPALRAARATISVANALQTVPTASAAPVPTPVVSVPTIAIASVSTAVVAHPASVPPTTIISGPLPQMSPTQSVQQQISRPAVTNPAISAIVSSLLNSAQQFQAKKEAQLAAAAAGVGVVHDGQPHVQTQPQPFTLASLLTSTAASKAPTLALQLGLPTAGATPTLTPAIANAQPAGFTQINVSPQAATVSVLEAASPQVATTVAVARPAAVQQRSPSVGLTNPGLSALLAGTPSADNPAPTSTVQSTLLERLSTTNQPVTTIIQQAIQAKPVTTGVSLSLPVGIGRLSLPIRASVTSAGTQLPAMVLTSTAVGMDAQLVPLPLAPQAVQLLGQAPRRFLLGGTATPRLVNAVTAPTVVANVRPQRRTSADKRKRTTPTPPQ